MRIAFETARVRVPATSGNLGPGFDCMGMAHDVWDEVSVRAFFDDDDASASALVDISGEGADYLPRDNSHLVVRALRRGLDHVGAPQPSVHLTCVNGIRQGRGLGSSASAIVAGLLLARGLIEDPQALSDRVILELATEFEGHPDNAAPAIFGGAVVGWVDERGAHAVPIPVREDLRTTLLIPDAELLTETARSVLPEKVPHKDAAFNASRTALLVLALEHDPSILFEATEERLHQQYRASAMQPSADALAFLREQRIPAVISGAGPSILVLAELSDVVVEEMARAGFTAIVGRPARGAHLV